jgi:REP element-mobilizing transposase RayT
MPRANRHYIPGCVWHITHRCHRREFLLKFAKDRHRWLKWLFEAKKRYGLSIFNYMATCNHIHLLVRDSGSKDTIPKSIQLIAARAGQEYNQRKNRKGAFWEDRYHATAVETDAHLVHCLVYIDLNMVRAGVVAHPSEWPFSGYNEIQAPRARYALIDYEGLRNTLGFRSLHDMAVAHKRWIEESLKNKSLNRDGKWTESVAVGSELFVRATKTKLGLRAKGRKVMAQGDSHSLREPIASYKGNMRVENEALRLRNSYIWKDSA